MIVKSIVDEDFTNYYKPSMLIAMPNCDWKCCKENNMPVEVCQNSPLAKQEDISISNEVLISRYINNPITKAIVFGGLEPINSFDEINAFLYYLRCIWYCKDDVVIYTGYNQNEIEWLLPSLSQFENIIIKYGRYIPNREKIFDNILGVTLSSNNQYAIKIS